MCTAAHCSHESVLCLTSHTPCMSCACCMHAVVCCTWLGTTQSHSVCMGSSACECIDASKPRVEADSPGDGRALTAGW
jgi:hypothetical protein